MLRGGRCTADKSHWRVGSARSVWAALGLPTHGVCAFPVDTARAPGCPAGELLKAGPGLRALPRAKPLRFGFSGTPHGRKRGWACAECPSPSEQLRGPGAWRALSLGAVLSPPLSQPSQVRCAACLFWGTDLWLLPSRRMSSVQDPRKARLATGSLLAVWWRMLSVGLSLPLSGSGCHLSTSLPPAGDGPVSCRLVLLWHLLSPLLWALQCLRLGLFAAKFLSPSLSLFFLWLSHSLGCYLMFAPSDCPQGIQSWSLL